LDLRQRVDMFLKKLRVVLQILRYFFCSHYVPL
jgi:hypothetical protein